jgi:3',5'-cyclic AMP phosphodiesterase CpdA
MFVRTLLFFMLLFMLGGPAQAQLWKQWEFRSDRVEANTLTSLQGVRATGEIMPEFTTRQGFQLADFDGRSHALLISDRIDTLDLPQRELTVAGWVMVDYPQSWGGFMSIMQDNGDYEKGWVFGYVTDRFSIGLASVGADRGGRGYMTYLQSAEPFRLGAWHHVAATYDGETMRLYVNGEFSSESKEQHGNILYPDATWFTLASYRDDDENNKHSGSLHSLQVWKHVLNQTEIRAQFEQHRELMEIPPTPRISLEGIVIAPYINFVTHTEATIGWMTSEPSSGRVRYGTHGDSLNAIASTSANRNIQQVKLTGLLPDTKYFYQVTIIEEDGTVSESELFTFQTAMPAGNAISFGIVADTQNNPGVWGTIAEHLWAERPHFVVHAGDMVSPGTDILKWIIEYFAPSRTLQERVPVFSVLGNHERNAQHYYDLMAYPDPGYYYTFEYTNVQFFMIDTNKDVTKDSEQYRWLDEQLTRSRSEWNIVVHHHPPFSSDEDDYGNAWTGLSTLGHTWLQDMVALYERHNVPLVITGHIHTYERTWPIRNGSIDTQRGVTYVVAGGGGGPLENAAPTRSWFTRKAYRGHHYAMAHVFEDTLEWITYDINGMILDQFTISLPSSGDE